MQSVVAYMSGSRRCLRIIGRAALLQDMTCSTHSADISFDDVELVAQ